MFNDFTHYIINYRLLPHINLDGIRHYLFHGTATEWAF